MMTYKAKTFIYTLFKEIEIDKIGVVTFSADAISRLTDTWIQDIINLYTDELTKSQKLIGVNNCSRARDLPAESESKKLDTKVPPIPLARVSNNSSDDSSKIDLVNSPKAEVSTSSTTSSSQINKSNKPRLPISILPDDSEEKRKHTTSSSVRILIRTLISAL